MAPSRAQVPAIFLALLCATLAGCSLERENDDKDRDPARVTGNELHERVERLIEEHPELINCGLYIEDDVLHVDVVGEEAHENDLEIEIEIEMLLDVPSHQVEVETFAGYCGEM